MCYSSNILLITHYLTSCTLQNLFYYWSLLAEIKSIACTHWNHKNSHIWTQFFNGKSWSWKPQLFVYNICHRDHVTILIQSWTCQTLSTIQSLHTNQAWSRKSMHRSLPPTSMPLLHNPCWRMALNEFELLQPFSRNPHWHLHWVLDAINAPL